MAAVELAVCLPLVAVVVFASIEACSMVFLKIALQTSAYEAARVAIAPNGTVTDAAERANQVLSQRTVHDGEIQVSPTNLRDLAVGQQVVVTATAPIASNRVIAGWFFGAGNLSASTVMLKEGNSY